MTRVVIRRRAVPEALSANGLHPLLARIYAARQVVSAADLDYSLARLAPVEALGGAFEAAALLERHLDSGRILVIGDFDADGATSTAVAVLGLRALGARHVDYLVPNRFEFGYGLTPEIVALARTRAPTLIVTVDNGVSSEAGVRAARAAGIDVLVTDHHLPGAVLPEANVIVDPNLPGDPFPSKALAGVGVMFYVLLALRRHLRERGHFAGQGEPNLAVLLDLVALGTVADVVPLDRNNRILVAQGIKRIRARQCRPGILALLEIARRSHTTVTAADLGYALGPRLNAAGRLDDMSLGIECLLADDAAAAREAALRLDELNRDRRELEAQMQADALAALDTMRLDDTGLPAGLCLFDERWHQGVVGLVAARIRERFHRPVIAFARGDGEHLKGSARSVPGLHIRDALDAIAARYPGLIVRFGGHAMAAGLTLRASDYPAFAAAFAEEVARHLSEDDLRGVVLTDGELLPSEICIECAELLRDGGPWGAGFPEPLFDGVFDVVERRVVGERHLKLRLAAPGLRAVDAIVFNAAEEAPPADRLHIAYRLDVNEYLGTRAPQLVVQHWEAA